jgi:hypothetical protein
MLNIDPILKRALRDNKNSRLHVLVILVDLARRLPPQAATASDLAEVLNCNRNTTEDLLHHMASDGYATRTQYGWIATGKATQLPLPNIQIEGEKQAHSDMEAHQSGLLSSALLSSSTVNVEKISTSVVVVDQLDHLDRSIDQQQTTNSDVENFHIEADRKDLRDALTGAGVRGGKRRDLIADAWVTVEIFERWLEIAQAMPLDNPTGYAITRCLEHEEPPEEIAEPDRFAADRARYRQHHEPDVAADWARVLQQRPRKS